VAEREDKRDACRSSHFAIAVWRRKKAESGRVKYCGTIVVVLAVLFASIALSEDIKTTSGKVYKDATVSRVEADGIELKTKTGIFKVYFIELPPEIQQRFHWAPPTPPRVPFYSRWAASAEDPAVLAKIIAAGASIAATVGLVVNYIRSRKRPTARVRRASPRQAGHRARS
jgi:hypothetical protein